MLHSTNVSRRTINQITLDVYVYGRLTSQLTRKTTTRGEKKEKTKYICETAYKTTCLIFSIVFVILMLTKDINAECSLEHLKGFAMNSCEELTLKLKEYHGQTIQNHVQFKREIKPNETLNELEEYEILKRHHRPTYMRINKKHFPIDGFLIFDHVYAKILKTSHPKYQIVKRPVKYNRNLRHHRYFGASKSKQSGEDNETVRRKRNDINDVRIPVSFCCENVNRCNAEHFCIL